MSVLNHMLIEATNMANKRIPYGFDNHVANLLMFVTISFTHFHDNAAARPNVEFRFDT